MGTSSARRDTPKGAYWRKAKAAAAWFVGPEPRFSVAEVVARYVLALAPLDSAYQVPPGALPEVVRTGAALGAFYEMWHDQGWEAALSQLDVPPQARQSWQTLIPTLLEALAGPGATLDQAVARTALLAHWEDMGLLTELSTDVTGEPPLPAADGVWHFLALALFHRAIADLGETLEFWASAPAVGLERQEAIKDHIMAQLNLLITLARDSDSWEAQTEAWLQDFLILLGNYHVR